MLQDKPVPITRKGLDKLQAELDELLSVKRPEVAERIKSAKEFGDISENAEYEDAKNDQGWIEGRIMTLDKMIRNAELIPESSRKASASVQLGSKVKVKDEFGESSYTIVGPVEADPTKGLISLESPVGKALMGRGKDDKVKVSTPGGTSTVTILSIR
ncbi:MAG TPA: transcription elongation factor GreA [Candidatus Dormibacteraeota bacterium]|nr:transcription elongation factor GreA [Candidatus Dormibacteraeota bacterium]